MTAQSQALTLGYQGVPGSYSEGALLKFAETTDRLKAASVSTKPFDSVSKLERHLDLVPRAWASPVTWDPSTPAKYPLNDVNVTWDSHQLLAAVKAGAIPGAFLPIENSLTGTFQASFKAILDSGLFVTGEFLHVEKHDLLALPGTKLEAIKEIRSHPQVLEQCQAFLGTLPADVTVSLATDTASVAQLIQEKKIATLAAIGGPRAAQLYGLQVIHPHCQDHEDNITRYYLIEKTAANPERHVHPKTTLSVTLKNRPGEFFRAIGCFSMRDLNLLKIESTPSTRTVVLSNPWEYVLTIEVEGSTHDPVLSKALSHLEEFSTVRNLGSFPRYQQSPAPLTAPYGIGM